MTLNRWWSLPAAAASLMLLSAAAPTPEAAAKAGPDACEGPTTIMLVRHAEKVKGQKDPPLTEAGQARAQALAHSLQHVTLAGVYTSTWKRTMATGAPAAKAAGLTPRADEEFSTTVAHVVAEHSGDTVLMVGHSNTVGPIIQAFGGPELEDLVHNEYDRLFVISRGCDETVRLQQLQFGVATEPEPEAVP